MEGNIHSTESFGTVDGPGIRFIVFMQGCTLKCKYCHNRDTWEIHSGTPTSTQELVSKILNYKTYIDNSGGGVTVSGGEPLLQTEFVTELFKELKKLGIHTALDTAGSLPISDKIKTLLEYTDLVILDIKHINDEKAKILTGFSNKNNLDFARYLSDIQKPMWIRQVLVPGYSDDTQDLQELKKFIDTLSSVKKVEILPYHTLGSFKWDELGVNYELKDVTPPSQEKIQESKNILGI